MTDFNMTFPIDIVKKEERIVTGIATADNIDKVGDLVDFSASLDAFKNWQGNIREMHAPIAVGKAIGYRPIKMKGVDGEEYNAIQVEAYISKGAENTWQKILDGTLRAFSIGGKILKKEMMQNKIHNGRQVHVIKEYSLGELSLVDNPANAMATIDLVKRNTNGDLQYVFELLDEELEKKQPLKDPRGGLTAAGRRHFKQTEGANLKPGVRGAADTPEKMRRKGSFLVRFFTNPSGPMKKPNGKPSRLALSASAWGEPVPQDRAAAARLAAKGRRLLERYRRSKEAKKFEDGASGLIDLIEDFDLDPNKAVIDVLLDSVYNDLEDVIEQGKEYFEGIDLENEENPDLELQNDRNYGMVKPMDNLIDGDENKLSLIKKFIAWLSSEPSDVTVEKLDTAEVSSEAEVHTEQMEEQEMDIEILKEVLGSVIDQKLNDFATSLKAEVEANVAAKIDEVAKGLENQKLELAQKLEATEKALGEQTAKVEQIANAGAVKKSVDPEDNDEEETVTKSTPKSVWNNIYLPQALIESMGYKS
jgi:hypothetical protein